MDSILDSIKKLLGISAEYEHFDIDIIMHINSTFVLLSQIGVVQAEAFSISDNSTTWDDFISDKSIIELIKMYVFLKVRLLFDPPSSSFVLESIKRTMEEYEWRIRASVDEAESLDFTK